MEKKEDDEGVSFVGLTGVEEHKDGRILVACGGRRCCPRTAVLPRGGAMRRGGAGAARCGETRGPVDSVGLAPDTMNRAAGG
jgi:hypothetical protein